MLVYCCVCMFQSLLIIIIIVIIALIAVIKLRTVE